MVFFLLFQDNKTKFIIRIYPPRWCYPLKYTFFSFLKKTAHTVFEIKKRKTFNKAFHNFKSIPDFYHSFCLEKKNIITQYTSIRGEHGVIKIPIGEHWIKTMWKLGKRIGTAKLQFKNLLKTFGNWAMKKNKFYIAINQLLFKNSKITSFCEIM